MSLVRDEISGASQRTVRSAFSCTVFLDARATICVQFEYHTHCPQFGSSSGRQISPNATLRAPLSGWFCVKECCVKVLDLRGATESLQVLGFPLSPCLPSGRRSCMA